MDRRVMLMAALFGNLLIIMLMGVAVNNAIVLPDCMLLQFRCLALVEAITRSTSSGPPGPCRMAEVQ